MLSVVLRSVQHRVTSFIATLIAASLSATLFAACGILLDSAGHVPQAPGRFAAATAVITADNQFWADPRTGLPIPHQSQQTGVLVGLAEQPRIEASVVERVGTLPGVRQAVGDISFPAQPVAADGRSMPGAGSDVRGHAWGSAVLTPYRLQRGRAPTASDEVVLDRKIAERGAWHLGGEVQVLTAHGLQGFRLVGVASPPAEPPGPRSIFFVPATADRLAEAGSRVDAIGVFAHPGTTMNQLQEQVTEALPGVPLTVRAAGEQDKLESPITSAYDAVTSYLVTMAVLAGFVSTFVMAGIFALGVQQRHREIGLLRVIGATPGQVRGLIVSEAAIVGLAGSAFGCLAGLGLAQALAAVLARQQVVPADFHLVLDAWPFVSAVGAGVATTTLAALLSARRAAGIAALAALREGAAHPAGAGRARLAGGLLLLTAGAAGLVFSTVRTASSIPNSSAGPAFLLAALVIAAAASLLAPFAVRPLGLLVGNPLAWLAPASGFLARANTVTNVVRVASAASPIMLTLTLVCTLLFTDQTFRDVSRAAEAMHTRADYLLGGGSAGLSPAVVDVVRRLPGVASAASSRSVAIAVAGRNGAQADFDHCVAATGPIASALQLEVRSGAPRDLVGAAIALSDAAGGHRAGEQLLAWLPDGTPVGLRVAATYRRDQGLADCIVPRELVTGHTGRLMDDTVYVESSPGASKDATARELRALSAAFPTLLVLDRQTYLAGRQTGSGVSGALVILLALTAGYAALAVVNTLTITSGERARELALLRLVGAGLWQVLRMIYWEALIAASIGMLLGTLISALTVCAFGTALSGRPALSYSPPIYLSLLVGCGALSLLASVVPARLALRTAAIEAARTAE